MELKAFITNLSKYNEGDLIGKWITLPLDDEEFEEELKEIGIGETDEFGQPYEEWFISDYDCEVPCTLGEYPSLEDLNEFAVAIEDADPDFLEDAIDLGYDVTDALEAYDNGTIYYYPGITDEEDLAYEVINSMGGVEVLGKDTIETYFDYEALGRDASFDSYESDDVDENGDVIYVTAGEYWCGDEDASDREIGEAIVEALGMDGVSNPENYFDYKMFGRDLTMENFTICKNGTIEET